MKISRKTVFQISIAILILITISFFIQPITRHLKKINAVQSITLERTSCLGNCPTYSLRIDASGDVIFIGKADFSRLGTHKGTITKAEFTELNQELLDFDFANINFPNLPEADSIILVRDKISKVCLNYVTDHPSMSISISTLTGEKLIKYYLGCSGLDVYPKFIKLGENMDKLTKSDKWIYPNSGE